MHIILNAFQKISKEMKKSYTLSDTSVFINETIHHLLKPNNITYCSATTIFYTVIQQKPYLYKVLNVSTKYNIAIQSEHLKYGTFSELHTNENV